jgi:hypothetical protein
MRHDDSMRMLVDRTREMDIVSEDIMLARHRKKEEEKKLELLRVEHEREQAQSCVDMKTNHDFYLRMFRKEVDFHHKIAYRFEKAYRLGKKTPVEKRHHLNLEIIECISDHASYIEQDSMALFYCLFFCIYYKNQGLVEFLRSLI